MSTLLSPPLMLLQFLYFFPLSFSLPENQEILLTYEKCGELEIPFPFHLNSSLRSVSDDHFRLSCKNSTALFLNISSRSYRVLEFFSDGVLVDFPGSSCRRYNNLNSFNFPGNGYFGVSVDNVVALYDCDDSSLCKSDCETDHLPGCDDGDGSSPGCCFPLSDRSVWRPGNDFSLFSDFGCRGFSSWIFLRGSNAGKRGVKLEWAVPRNSAIGACDVNAYTVNSTVIVGGGRCSCAVGYVGDGFANGLGCFKSCVKDGEAAYGSDCYSRNHTQRKLVILTGLFVPVFVLASMAGILLLLKRPVGRIKLDSKNGCLHEISAFQKSCKTRLYEYSQLEAAIKGGGDSQKLEDRRNGLMYNGVFENGSYIAVQKALFEREEELINALSRIEVLSEIRHRNMATLLGCCVISCYSVLVVYENPRNGTLQGYLRGKKPALDWCRRMKIASDIARVLTFLQNELSPPVFHNKLKSSHVFLDADFSAKIFGFGLIDSASDFGSRLGTDLNDQSRNRSDVHNFGMVLLELIAGSDYSDPPMEALQKIKNGKIEEVADPNLNFHEQPPFQREQMKAVADLAIHCVSIGKDGELGMTDVKTELRRITNGNLEKRPALEETFSNSSLLQMISMSPDSIHLP